MFFRKEVDKLIANEAGFESQLPSNRNAQSFVLTEITAFEDQVEQLKIGILRAVTMPWRSNKIKLEASA